MSFLRCFNFFNERHLYIIKIDHVLVQHQKKRKNNQEKHNNVENKIIEVADLLLLSLHSFLVYFEPKISKKT